MQNLSKDVQKRIDRVQRIIDSWVRDALNKPDFKGHVSIDIHLAGGNVMAVEPKLHQVIRNFGDE